MVDVLMASMVRNHWFDVLMSNSNGSNICHKTNRGAYSEEEMTSAPEYIRKCDLPKQASIESVIPRTTLLARFKNQNPYLISLSYFTRIEYEEQLINYILEMQKRFYGLSLIDFRSLAFQLATRNNLNNQFDKDLKLAGKSLRLGLFLYVISQLCYSPEAKSWTRGV